MTKKYQKTIEELLGKKIEWDKISSTLTHKQLSAFLKARYHSIIQAGITIGLFVETTDTWIDPAEVKKSNERIEKYKIDKQQWDERAAQGIFQYANSRPVKFGPYTYSYVDGLEYVMLNRAIEQNKIEEFISAIYSADYDDTGYSW